MTRVLNIRCPHCRYSIELLDESDVHSIHCSSCGSDFSLVGSSEIGPPDGTKRIGQYQFVEQVGVGQYGAVWKARDLTLERTVAIKIPRKRQLLASEVTVLLRDARVAAQLSHPHIVSVHEVGRHEDLIYIVSDFVDGESLKERLATDRPSVEDSARLCATISEALHYAHECGVVHRDLKPGNIMLDRAGQPHLVDFGLAKQEVGELTMTVDGQILGTPAYMSPEQAKGQAHWVGRTADIYSLGVIMFEMLTGQLPFQGSQSVLLVRIVNDPPTDPRLLNPKLPRDISTICLKCLEKQPQDRYQTARELAEDCRRFLAGEPVRARPLSTVVRAYRWSRKKPWLAGLWMACALLLIGIAIVSSVGYLRTQAALSLANVRADTIERNLYFAEMTRAGWAASHTDGLAEVRRLLGHWRPKNSRIDRRGWEWYYLDSLLHQDLATLADPAGEIRALSWNSSGTSLASAGSDYAIRIWKSDGTIQSTLRGHISTVRDIAWSSDSSMLASASDDGQVRIWDSASGTCKLVLPHAEPVTGIAWGKDRQQIASVCTEIDEAGQTGGTVRVWSATTGEIHKLIKLPLAATSRLLWNHASDHIAVAPTKGRVIVIEATDGKQVCQIGEDEQIFSSFAWNPDGSRLACNYFKGAPFISVWTMEGTRVRQIPVNAAVASMEWSPDGRQLAYVDGNRTAKVKDLESNSPVAWLQGHLSQVTALSWHPEGHRIATGDIEGKIKLWRPNSPDAMHSGSATIAWKPDSSRYASRVGESVVLCNLAIDRLNTVDLLRHQWNVLDLAWSPSGQFLASLTYAGELCLTDVETAQTKWFRETKVRQIGSRPPGLLAWRPDSKYLAVPFDDHAVYVLDALTGDKVKELSAEIGRLTSIAWNPCYSKLAAGTSDQCVRIWDPVSGRLIDILGDTEDGNLRRRFKPESAWQHRSSKLESRRPATRLCGERDRTASLDIGRRECFELLQRPHDLRTCCRLESRRLPNRFSGRVGFGADLACGVRATSVDAPISRWSFWHCLVARWQEPSCSWLRWRKNGPNLEFRGQSDTGDSLVNRRLACVFSEIQAILVIFFFPVRMTLPRLSSFTLRC